MKIFLGSDHGGFDLKQMLVHYLSVKQGLLVEDVGDHRLDPDDDYPQFAQQTVHSLLNSDDNDPRAILVCRGGQGMAIAANRFKGIRAAVCWDENSAKKSREDNDSNVLCLPADILSVQEAKNIIHIWLDTPFSKAVRHQRRIKEIDQF
jgi:ribose 5-phosphate isomerase B